MSGKRKADTEAKPTKAAKKAKDSSKKSKPKKSTKKPGSKRKETADCIASHAVERIVESFQDTKLKNSWAVMSIDERRLFKSHARLLVANVVLDGPTTKARSKSAVKNAVGYDSNGNEVYAKEKEEGDSKDAKHETETESKERSVSVTVAMESCDVCSNQFNVEQYPLCPVCFCAKCTRKHTACDCVAIAAKESRGIKTCTICQVEYSSAFKSCPDCERKKSEKTKPLPSKTTGGHIPKTPFSTISKVRPADAPAKPVPRKKEDAF